VRIDLHAHSNASDGTDSPADVVRRAAAAGIDVLALTDHDTVAGIDDAMGALPPGLALVAGSEISCAAVAGGSRTSVHLLAYLFDRDEPELAAELARLRTDRERRGRAMVERINELGASLGWEAVTAIARDAPIGRPHIAQALVAQGAVASFEDAFSSDWIGNGGRAYVPKHALEPALAVRLVRAAGGVAVLAHPGVGKRGSALADAQIAALAAEGLFGLEVDHPDHDDETRARLCLLAGDLGLVMTGSSDDHGSLTGHRLGCETTSEPAYDAIVDTATGAQPVRA
jgi:predicted metal-dependent phosphoesterase TrpH